MFNVQELMEYRMQQQIAQEIYRQQIMQRIPGKFIAMKTNFSLQLFKTINFNDKKKRIKKYIIP